MSLPAYLKAIGVGLSVAPDSFEIPAKLAAGSLIFEMPEVDGPPASWSVREITSHAGYAGALVVEGSPWELLTYHSDGTFGLIIEAWSAECCGRRLLLYVSSDPVRHHNHILVREPTPGRRNFGVASLGKFRRSFNRGSFDGVSLRLLK